MQNSTPKLNLHVDGIEEAIRDKSVSTSYMAALTECSSLFEDKEVLTIFSGHGLLALFCCRTKAKQVHAICETKQELEILRILLEENKLRDRATLYLGPIEASYFDQKVDIIVSMPFGYCLYFGNAVETLLFVRDNYLKKDGLMFPNKLTLRCSMIQDSYYYDKKILFWEDVYNIDMSQMIKWVMTEPIIDLVDPSVVSTTIETLTEIDLYSANPQQLDFVKPYQLKVREDNINLHGLVIWFDAHFSHGSEESILSTSPFCRRTKYKQSIFYLQNEIAVSKGDTIKGTIAVKRSDNRTNFKISYHCKEHNLIQYYFLT